jgi:hypothetical protein
MANLDLLNELFDQAANDPDHNQVSWRSCIAGMAVAQSEGFVEFQGAASYLDTSGKIRLIETRAREVLGLNSNQAADLFFAGLSGDWEGHDIDEVRHAIDRIAAEELVSA